MSPRKVRLVTGMLRGLKIDVARTQLAFLPKAAALPVLKALNSAVANAVNNLKLDESSLTILAATADQGPVLARWRARAMGRAAPIKKRSTHITVIVTDGKPQISTTKSQDTAQKPAAKVEEPKASKKEAKPAEKKSETKPKAAKKPAKALPVEQADKAEPAK
jgi:large subunit ribosomal protein L22